MFKLSISFLYLLTTFSFANASTDQKTLTYTGVEDVISYSLEGKDEESSGTSGQSCHGPQVRVCRPVTRQICRGLSGCRSHTVTSCRMEYRNCTTHSSNITKKTYVAKVNLHMNNLVPEAQIEDKLHGRISYVKFPELENKRYSFKFSLSDSKHKNVVYKVTDYQYEVKSISPTREELQINYFVDVVPVEEVKEAFLSPVKELSLGRQKLSFEAGKGVNNGEYAPFVKIVKKIDGRFRTKLVTVYEGQVDQEFFNLYALGESTMVEVDLKSLLGYDLKSGRYEVGVSSTTANPLVSEYGSNGVLDMKRLPAFEVFSSLKYKLINKVKIKELVTETFDL
ncbi:MAG: hypothetical protein KC478_06445 [Bacteriovoracaceae bacterium]|nr:hypothetical protein [Bacteriovoracaceae bacterium]